MRYEAGKEATFVPCSSAASKCIQMSLGRKTVLNFLLLYILSITVVPDGASSILFLSFLCVLIALFNFIYIVRFLRIWCALSFGLLWRDKRNRYLNRLPRLQGHSRATVYYTVHIQLIVVGCAGWVKVSVVYCFGCDWAGSERCWDCIYNFTFDYSFNTRCVLVDCNVAHVRFPGICLVVIPPPASPFGLLVYSGLRSTRFFTVVALVFRASAAESAW